MTLQTYHLDPTYFHRLVSQFNDIRRICRPALLHSCGGFGCNQAGWQLFVVVAAQFSVILVRNFSLPTTFNLKSNCTLTILPGGEDGGVKVLDIFCERRHRSILTGDSSSSVFQNSRTPCPDSLPPSHGSPGTAYVRPYANVVQTLPSHESSVAALAIAIPAENTSGSGWDREAFIASGGGKMELRAWRTEGWRGNGINAGDERREGEAMVCAPPVCSGYGVLRTLSMVGSASPRIMWSFAKCAKYAAAFLISPR